MPLTLTDLPLLATPKQASEVMGPTESQVRALIRTNKLAHVMVGTRVMIPRDAIEKFISNNTVTPCRAETKGRDSTGTAIASVGTSLGQSEAAAGSAARALQIVQSLRSPSRTSCTKPDEQAARVIPLRSSSRT
jgi:excisionase family DNA binding protein